MTPIGLCARICGKDFLSVTLSKNAPSYWISRTKPGGDKRSYENQF
jgi:hypothetical protein